MHHGKLPMSGHYNAFISKGSCRWLCEDGQSAVQLPDLPAWSSKVVYLIYIVRVDCLDMNQACEVTRDGARFSSASKLAIGHAT